MRQWCYAALGGLLLIGCAARGPLYRPVSLPDGHAAIYVYRPHSNFQRAGYPNVYVEGKSPYPLRNNSYGVSVVPAGRYEVKVSGSLWTNWMIPDSAIVVHAKAGESVFLRYVPEFSGTYVIGSTAGVTGTPSFHAVPEAEALRQIVQARQSD